MGISSLHGTCKKCGSETIDYECWRCLRNELDESQKAVANRDRTIATLERECQRLAAALMQAPVSDMVPALGVTDSGVYDAMRASGMASG